MFGINRKIKVTMVFLTAGAFVFSGCAAVRDKLVRKPKEEKSELKQYYGVKQYDVRPSLELYTKRYIFWKSWHREIEVDLDDANSKKAVIDVEEALSNLRDMWSMLVPEQGDALEELMLQMKYVEDVLKNERLTGGNKVRLRKKIESLERNIKRNFSYNKMKEFISGDFRR